MPNYSAYCKRCGKLTYKHKQYQVGAEVLTYCPECYKHVTKKYRPIGANKSSKIVTEKEGTYEQPRLI